jgi:hypothetical protein
MNNDQLKPIIDLIQSLEMRVDHNFNTILQMTLLIEYAYKLLEKHNISVDEEEFQQFQQERVDQLQAIAEKTAEEFSQMEDSESSSSDLEEEVQF